jgi:hypothetical protein
MHIKNVFGDIEKNMNKVLAYMSIIHNAFHRADDHCSSCTKRFKQLLFKNEKKKPVKSLTKYYRNSHDDTSFIEKNDNRRKH